LTACAAGVKLHRQRLYLEPRAAAWRRGSVPWHLASGCTCGRHGGDRACDPAAQSGALDAGAGAGAERRSLESAAGLLTGPGSVFAGQALAQGAAPDDRVGAEPSRGSRRWRVLRRRGGWLLGQEGRRRGRPDPRGRGPRCRRRSAGTDQRCRRGRRGRGRRGRCGRSAESGSVSAWRRVIELEVARA
jgi:hypothetical protein